MVRCEVELLQFLGGGKKCIFEQLKEISISGSKIEFLKCVFLTKAPYPTLFFFFFLNKSVLLFLRESSPGREGAKIPSGT